MQWLGARSFEFALFSVLCLSAGCASRGSTRLCANFKSYQSLEDVRTELGRRGLTSGWTENSQGTAATDRRPAYKMVSLSGPYKLAGIEGRLRFTFYNGQLMETEFSPQEKGEDCLTILRKEMPEMPQKPAEEIVMDRRTRFRFDVAPNGDISLSWYDPQIEKQWMKWVAKSASVAPADRGGLFAFTCFRSAGILAGSIRRFTIPEIGDGYVVLCRNFEGC